MRELLLILRLLKVRMAKTNKMLPLCPNNATTLPDAPSRQKFFLPRAPSAQKRSRIFMLNV